MYELCISHNLSSKILYPRSSSIYIVQISSNEAAMSWITSVVGWKILFSGSAKPRSDALWSAHSTASPPSRPKAIANGTRYGNPVQTTMFTIRKFPRTSHAAVSTINHGTRNKRKPRRTHENIRDVQPSGYNRSERRNTRTSADTLSMTSSAELEPKVYGPFGLR